MKLKRKVGPVSPVRKRIANESLRKQGFLCYAQRLVLPHQEELPDVGLWAVPAPRLPGDNFGGSGEKRPASVPLRI